MSLKNDTNYESSWIDKSSPIPYHYQLMEIVRSQITNKNWDIGDQLPSENQMCEQFDISRTTVRKALDTLVAEGLLIREKGVGTFIADPKFNEKWSNKSIGFSDSINQQGYLIETKVLELRTIEVPQTIHQELHLKIDDPVFVLKRLRFIHKQPILVVHSYLPTTLFPDLDRFDFTHRSLYQTFRENYNYQIMHVKRSIESIAADKHIAQLLEVEVGFPIMYIENTTYDNDRLPLEYYQAWRRGDKSRFQFEYSVPVE